MRLLWVLGFVAGCIHVHVPPAGTPRAGAGLSPGDRVVARRRTEFREATVITVEGSLVTVAWDVAEPERSQLARNWIVRVDERGRGRTHAGDWRLCPGDETWLPCRADLVGSGLALQYADGSNRTVPPRESLPIPEGLTNWARTRGQRFFDRSVVAPPPHEVHLDTSLRPRRAGHQVAVGDKVIAHWSGGGWWEATVTKLAPNQVVVAWADGSPATPVAGMDVAPLTNDFLGTGDVALCRWTDTQWWPARVMNRAANRLSILYADGTAAETHDRDCVAATPVVGSI